MTVTDCRLNDQVAVINIASIESLRSAPGFAVYAACKAAMAPDIIATPGLYHS